MIKENVFKNILCKMVNILLRLEQCQPASFDGKLIETYNIAIQSSAIITSH